MKVRKAISIDVKHVYGLLHEEKNKSFSVQNFRDAVNHKESIFLVAEDEHKIIGYIIGFICPGKKEDCMLAETRVIESSRNKGIGKMLVESFSTEAFRRGAKTIYSDVAEKDVIFYSKTGFKKSDSQWIEMVRTKL